MFRFFIAFLLFFLVSTSSNAVTGCIDGARTAIYTSLSTNGKYWQGTPASSGAGCFFIYTGGGCKIGNVASNNGLLGDDSNPKQCPIDDYVWVMMILFGGVGFYIIRQKNMRLAVIS